MRTSDNCLVSVVVCTYNSLSELKKSLDAILDQTFDKHEYEVVVVDNNSDDGTAEYVKSLLPEHENLKYFFEHNQGLSYARNRGIDESRGEIITFIDDDSVAEPNFVEVIAKKFRAHPSILCLGGKIIQQLDFEVPPWVRRPKYMIYLTIGYDAGDGDIFLDNSDHGPTGGNISFRRGVFDQFGRFDVRLGRMKEKYLANEEEVLLRKIKQIKHSCLYTPDALVRHLAKQRRVGRKYLLNKAYYKGVSDARSGYAKHEINHILAEPIWKKILRAPKLLALQFVAAIKRVIFFIRFGTLPMVMTLAYNAGYYLERWREARDRKVTEK